MGGERGEGKAPHRVEQLCSSMIEEKKDDVSGGAAVYERIERGDSVPQ